MTSTDLATTGESEWDDTGLEDFDSTRISMPRLSIEHPDGMFKNSQTTETFGKIRGVFLGMVKQRAMFHGEMPKEGKLGPQCKSSDAETGYPTMKGKPEDLFPWSEVAFKPADLEKDEFGRPTIKCSACPFAQWDNKKPPRCAERHAYPVLFSSDEGWTPGDEMPNRGIVSFQKSGIKPSIQFLTVFKNQKAPVYSQYAEISLQREKRGSVVYSVPVFKRLGATDREVWPEFSADLKGVREFLRQPPRPGEDEESSGGSKPASSVVESTAKVSESAPVADPWASDDDDLPF